MERSGVGWRWLAGAAGLLMGCLVLGLAGCSTEDDYRRYAGETMGTYYQVTAQCPGDVGGLIEAELVAVNAEMSTYLPDSDLSRFNSAAMGDWFPVPETVVGVVDVALELSRSSAGAFDVTVGPLVNLWGFGPEAGHGVPESAAIAAVLSRVGFESLEARRAPAALRKSRDLYVDLSAIAKGHGVDRVAERLMEAGCANLLVDIGGEVRGRGVNPRGAPWRIGVEVPDPASMGGIQRIVQVADAALATSGDYRNFIELNGRRFSHTIDPRTGYPVEHALASVTVVHDSAMWADGYATLLNVLGPDAGWTYAMDHQLAVLFVVRGESGFEERYTPPFEAVLDNRWTGNTGPEHPDRK
jgi:FAD:protein FMN transferase